MKRTLPRWFPAGVLAALLAGCSAPPLTLYTLAAPASPAATQPSLGTKPLVIEIARLSVPDELDSQDIVVRDGSILQRSSSGRWASRFSLGATDRLTARLAATRPAALITDRQQSEPPTYRIVINLGRLDVDTAGHATLEADWLIVPHDPTRPVRRNRVRFVATGPVAADQDVVALDGIMLDRLAGAIDIAGL